MKNKLNKILEILKEEYNNRKELIDDNIKDIKNTPINKETIDVKIELDELNKELKKLNESNIELQNAINNYINIHLEVLHNDDNLTYDRCFQLTISGAIHYNELNPYFKDDDFYNDLLSYFIEKEDYEKCKLIKKSRFDVID